jgi:hypothetical protein
MRGKEDEERMRETTRKNVVSGRRKINELQKKMKQVYFLSPLVSCSHTAEQDQSAPPQKPSDESDEHAE